MNILEILYTQATIQELEEFINWMDLQHIKISINFEEKSVKVIWEETENIADFYAEAEKAFPMVDSIEIRTDDGNLNEETAVVVEEVPEFHESTGEKPQGKQNTLQGASGKPEETILLAEQQPENTVSDLLGEPDIKEALQTQEGEALDDVSSKKYPGESSGEVSTKRDESEVISLKSILQDQTLLNKIAECRRDLEMLGSGKQSRTAFMSLQISKKIGIEGDLLKLATEMAILSGGNIMDLIKCIASIKHLNLAKVKICLKNELKAYLAKNGYEAIELKNFLKLFQREKH